MTARTVRALYVAQYFLFAFATELPRDLPLLPLALKLGESYGTKFGQTFVSNFNDLLIDTGLHSDLEILEEDCRTSPYLVLTNLSLFCLGDESCVVCVILTKKYGTFCLMGAKQPKLFCALHLETQRWVARPRPDRFFDDLPVDCKFSHVIYLVPRPVHATKWNGGGGGGGWEPRHKRIKLDG